ncbi:Aldehyde/histidinol dehydrogenase [Apiosordaria backusii]|uniref:aldehyde dehydrogenase (NAD(+)) n=1 Tax=Apiosordaria backusii TaxID=314023 RepID=A0AA40BLB5_9PEZI|nr:Aldehyde/histidinol dehydrogenase [Apiosordaria backusii]
MGSTTDLPKVDFSSNFQNIINNALSSTPETRQAVDPSTEELLYPVPLSKQSDVDNVVSAAKAAFPAWRDLSYDERAQYIVRYADAVEANLAGLQELLMKEAGKPVSNAAGELAFALAHLRETAKIRLEDEGIEDGEERKASVRYVPLGVGVGIVPWNYPVLLGLGKLDAAVLTGNTFIWKPSPYSPYTALKLGEIAAQIFPPGVISFTGSTMTGKKVMQASASTLKRLTLELGGNDAAIVCEDVDVGKVVQKIGPMAFMHSDQICMDIKRLSVHEKIYDEFLAALVPVVKSFKFAKVKELYSEIGKQNWQVATGGEPAARQAELWLRSLLAPSCLFSNGLMRMRSLGRRANNTNMGLGASVWSNDIAKAEKLAKRLEAGSIWVNSHFELSPYVPSGGHKWSGIGMDWGVIGMKGWCNTQAYWVRKTIYL